MKISRLLPPLLLCLTAACNDNQPGAAGASGTTGTLALGGTAAVGSPIAGATIDIKCVGDTSSTSVTTGTDGSYTATVNGAPCVLRVSYGSPVQTLYSVATAAGVTNITPFTDLVVAAMGQTTGDAFFAGFPGNAAQITTTALSAAVTLVKARLDNLGVDVSGIDLLNQAFLAQSGNGYDDKLEALHTRETALDTTQQVLEDDVAHGRDDFSPLTTPTLKFVDAGDGVVRVTWTPMQAGVTYTVHYDVAGSVAPGSSPPPAAFQKAEASSPIEIGSLTDGSPYYFYVTASNGSQTATSGQGTTTPHAYGDTFTSLDDSHNPNGNAVSFTAAAYQQIAGEDVYVAVKTSQEIAAVRMNSVSGTVDRMEYVSTGDTVASKLKAVAAGKGVFIAVGPASKVYYSADGFSWSALGMPVDGEFNAITYANGRFVLAGRGLTGQGNGTDMLVTLSFNPEDAPACPTTCASTVPYYASNVYKSTGADNSTQGLLQVAYGSAGFVALAGNGGFTASNSDDISNTILMDGSTYTYTSADGMHWTQNTVSAAHTLATTPVRMIYGQGFYYALSGFNGGLYRSSDGLNWSSAANVSFVGANPQDIVYGPGQFVSIDQLTDTFLSKNGTTWTKKQGGFPSNENVVLTFGNSRYVAFGGFIYQSH